MQKLGMEKITLQFKDGGQVHAVRLQSAYEVLQKARKGKRFVKAVCKVEATSRKRFINRYPALLFDTTTFHSFSSW
jgi:hypothetical protein